MRETTRDLPSRSPTLHHPALVASAVAALALIGASVYAGPGAAAIFYYVLVDGSLCALWLASAAGWGVWPTIWLLRGANSIQPPCRLLVAATSIALGLGLLGLLILGLGLAGLLNQPTSILALVTGAAAGITGLYFGGTSSVFRLHPGRSDAASTGPVKEDSFDGVVAWRWLWLLAAPVLACVVVAAAMPPGMLWKPEEPHGFDAVAYHLQVPREWYEAGRIVPLQHNVFSYFPFGVEVHFLLAFHVKGGAWNGMYLAQLMHAGFTATAVFATYGFAKRLSGNRPLATIGAVALASTPWLAQLAPIAFNEGGLLLYVALSAGWAMEAMRRSNGTPVDSSPSRRRLWILAGLMAGFGAGVKLTGVPLILLAVPVAAVCVLGCHGLRYSAARGNGHPRQNDSHGQRSTAAHGTLADCTRAEACGLPSILAGSVLFVFVGVLAMSPWLVRNAVWCGNPVFPQATSLFGKAHFTDIQVERWNRAHAPQPDAQSIRGRLAAFGGQVAANWQFGYVLIPLGVVSLAIGWRRPEAQFLALLVLAHALVWLGFTHLQGRFFVPALPLLALAIATTSHTARPRSIETPVTPALVAVQGGRELRLAHFVIAAICVATAAIMGWKQIDARLRPTLAGLRDATGRDVRGDILTGENLDWLSTAMLDGFPIDDPRTSLLLVGDGRAFWQRVPMTRLRYRTPFDLAGGPETTVLDAYGSPDDRTWVLMDPAEIKRFHRTYQPFPSIPPEVLNLPEWQGESPIPYLIIPPGSGPAVR